MEEQIQVEPEKVKAVIKYLSNYLLELPEYNDIHERVQKSIMALYDIESNPSMSEHERSMYNELLEQAEAPENLLF